jgi:hypothetical protein
MEQIFNTNLHTISIDKHIHTHIHTYTHTRWKAKCSNIILHEVYTHTYIHIVDGWKLHVLTT